MNKNQGAGVSIEVKRAINLPNLTTELSSKNSNQNPDKKSFFQDKRRWDDCFTIAERNELEGNVVKTLKDNDGETYHVTLKEEEFIVPKPSITTTPTTDAVESQESDSYSNKKPGRKPLPDEDGYSDPEQDPKVKRKQQNRAAQRAFRERKEKYVKDLETKFKQVQDNHVITTSQLVRENQQLRALLYKIELENASLKGVPFQPSFSPPQILPLPNPYTIPSTTTSTTTITTTTNHPTIPPKLLPKKVPIKQCKKVPILQSQPLEYTFSISTPASLRSKNQSSSSFKLTSEPIQLVPLLPPTSTFKNLEQPASPNKSTANSPSILQNDFETSSIDSTTTKNIHQLEVDLSDCHIGQDKFICDIEDTFIARLLSEPLFGAIHHQSKKL